MKVLKKITLASLLVMVAFGTAVAGEGKGMKGKMPTFSDFDLDGDGVITEQEFNEGHAKKMNEMAAEGRKMKCAESCPGFAGIDTDKNGGISNEEFSAHQTEHMHKHKHQGEHKQEK